MNEVDFSRIVGAVCKHRKVYTKNGTFLEVVTFLEGYALGANVGNNDSHSRFTPFLQWIADKFHEHNSIINWDEFRQMFSDENEACNNLAALYSDYANSLNSS